MKTQKDTLFEMLNEIHRLIDEHSNEDGSVDIDFISAQVALDFAKTEIQKGISNESR